MTINLLHHLVLLDNHRMCMHVVAACRISLCTTTTTTTTTTTHILCREHRQVLSTHSTGCHGDSKQCTHNCVKSGGVKSHYCCPSLSQQVSGVIPVLASLRAFAHPFIESSMWASFMEVHSGFFLTLIWAFIHGYIWEYKYILLSSQLPSKFSDNREFYKLL